MPPSLKKLVINPKGVYSKKNTYLKGISKESLNTILIADSKSPSDKTSTSDSSKNDESKTDQNSKDSFTSSISSNHSSSKNDKNDSSGNEVSTSLGSSSAITVDSADSSGTTICAIKKKLTCILHSISFKSLILLQKLTNRVPQAVPKQTKALVLSQH